MTKHEELKEICDLIEYDLKKYGLSMQVGKITIKQVTGYRVVNVREIIFTPEFMEKLTYALKVIMGKDMARNKVLGLMDELHDPVTYLYNTLELGNNQQ